MEYIEYETFVNSERSLADCIRSEIQSKVVLMLPQDFPLQPGYILSVNKLAPLPEMETSNILWV